MILLCPQQHNLRFDYLNKLMHFGRSRYTVGQTIERVSKQFKWHRMYDVCSENLSQMNKNNDAAPFMHSHHYSIHQLILIVKKSENQFEFLFQIYRSYLIILFVEIFSIHLLIIIFIVEKISEFK